MDSDPGLNAGFFVGAEDEVVGREGLSFPLVRVEVEHAAGLFGEAGVAGENPGAVLPGPDGVFMEPAPYGFIAQGGDDSAVARVAQDIRGAQS
jgi:hypothetical protein